MKKIILSFTVLILNFLPLFAQNPFEILRGKEQEMRNGTLLQNIVSDGKGNAYVLYHPGIGMDNYIAHFNDSLQIDHKEPFSLWFDGKYQSLEMFTIFHDSLYIFSSARDTWLTKNSLYLRKVDRKTLKVSPPILFDESPNLNGFFPRYYVDLSENKDKMAVYCFTETLKNDKTIRIKLKVLDKDMKVIMQDEKLFAGVNRDAYIREGKVDNQGNVFFLMWLYQEGLFDVKAKFKNQLGVLSFYRASKTYRVDRIDYPFKYLRSADIVPDNQGNINCVGSYSETYANRYTKGLFFVTIDSLKGKVVNKILPYDYYFLQQLQTKKELQNNEELFNYRLDKSFIRPDKSVVVLLEQRYGDYSQNDLVELSGFLSYNQRNYFFNLPGTLRFNKLVVMKIKSDGELDWSRIINKEQNHYDYINFCSFGIYAPQDSSDFYIFYNQNRRNPKHKPKTQQDPFQFSRKFYSSLQMVSLNNYGELKNETIFDTDPKQCVPIPTFNFDGNNGEFIIAGEYYRKLNLLRFRLKR